MRSTLAPEETKRKKKDGGPGLVVGQATTSSVSNSAHQGRPRFGKVPLGKIDTLTNAVRPALHQ